MPNRHVPLHAPPFAAFCGVWPHRTGRHCAFRLFAGRSLDIIARREGGPRGSCGREDKMAKLTERVLEGAHVLLEKAGDLQERNRDRARAIWSARASPKAATRTTGVRRSETSPPRMPTGPRRSRQEPRRSRRRTRSRRRRASRAKAARRRRRLRLRRPPRKPRTRASPTRAGFRPRQRDQRSRGGPRKPLMGATAKQPLVIDASVDRQAAWNSPITAPLL